MDPKPFPWGDLLILGGLLFLLVFALVGFIMSLLRLGAATSEQVPGPAAWSGDQFEYLLWAPAFGS